MNTVETIAFTLYLETWGHDEISDIDDETMENLVKKWREEWLPLRESEHSGDCTKQPWTCMRCLMDRMWGDSERIAAFLRKQGD